MPFPATSTDIYNAGRDLSAILASGSTHHTVFVMRQGPEDVLRDYVRAFESLGADAVVPFYRLPCLFLSRHGPHPVSDPAAARDLVHRLIEQARGQGYHHTEILDLDVRALGEDLAWVAGVFSRRDADQEEIARFGFAYTLIGEGDGWKICVAIAHELNPAAT